MRNNVFCFFGTINVTCAPTSVWHHVFHLAKHNNEIQGLGFWFRFFEEFSDGFDHRLHCWIVLDVEHWQLPKLFRLDSAHLVAFASQRCLPLHIGDVVGDGGGEHLQAVKLHVHIEDLAKLDQQSLPLTEDLKQGRAWPRGMKRLQDDQCTSTCPFSSPTSGPGSQESSGGFMKPNMILFPVKPDLGLSNFL